ncbi:P-loop containing nucleoside triphosphate hydrolase protein [Xylaria bambusicola]|uniref:P-loop containing nucleoside triphosphate hydrolase protein n=1 Tax=Xylaria bambusicola TaxID=326684 RepID=UPI0020074D94|nr:P-loop containing nucleoside triphosphate hydrolase protein [Xylaria bambusicola]KAI0515095.1 P-loop containing nucleoside triphosphate hydrolase protein [Xylaria bambusicola]
MSNLLEVEMANFLAFLGAQRPKPDSVFLLVMGVTGSGKSSFIADCTGRNDVCVGHDLASCTNSVAIFRAELHDRDVYLIDTPGFDDTNREDVQILTAVAHYLSVSYANNVSINGVLYLHRISDTRIGSSTRRSLEMMKALCGEDAFENVAIVTTMWSSNHCDAEYAKQCSRERELRDTHLFDMLERGSQVVNHNRYQRPSQRCSSAKEILTMMVDSWKDTKVTLQIQHEMVNLNLILKESSAGKVLEEDIKRHQSSFTSELETLRVSGERFDPQGHRTADTLLRSRDSEIRKMLAENNQALDAMRLSLLEIHKKQEQRFIEQVSMMQKKWRDTLKEKEEECRLKELEYRNLSLCRQEEEMNGSKREVQENQVNTRRLVAAENALAYEREAFSELARQGHRQLAELQHVNRQQHDELMKAKRRDRVLYEELERMRSDLKKLRRETQSNLNTTEKAKIEWVGPLIQGVVTGGIGIVGTCITAGMLCCVQ